MAVDEGEESWSFYPEGMQPVSFPSAEADTARAACERIAGLLDGHLAARPALVASSRDGWEGTFRAEFDETWSVQESRLVGLREDLVCLAGRISDAATATTTVNEARAGERLEYLHERTAGAT